MPLYPDWLRLSQASSPYFGARSENLSGKSRPGLWTDLELRSSPLARVSTVMPSIYPCGHDPVDDIPFELTKPIIKTKQPFPLAYRGKVVADGAVWQHLTITVMLW